MSEHESQSGSWSLGRTIALVVAIGFLAGAIGYVVGRGTDSSASAVDVGFYTDMRTHHEQAVEMSLIQLENGDSPIVKGFAREIATAQSYEIGLMDAGLAKMGEPLERPAVAMEWMGMPVPYEEMDGLATAEQMAEFRETTGRAADEMFLEIMSVHHVGGIHMALYAVEHGSDEDLRELAARMARVQIAEIEEYRMTVDQLGLDAHIPVFDESDEHDGH